MQDETRAASTDGKAAAETQAEQDDGVFDFAWARSSPTHELSAHGRSVQQRLDAPAPKPAKPSLCKRLRFALYRMRSGR